MGIQTMVSQQSHLQPSQLMRQNSWYSLTLNQVESQLVGSLGKPLGSMNLDEILKNLWSSEGNDSMGMDIENSSSAASSLQRQASLTLARSLSGKTVDQVWKEIQYGQKKRFGQDVRGQEREATFGELTLEDFLVQAGLFDEALPNPSMDMVVVDAVTPQSFPQKMALSSSPSTRTFSDTTLLGRKRDATDSLEKSIDRRLKRKIKNIESAARSRARKQAYHNELENKVSRLEEQNIKLKKEKEFETTFPREPSEELKYQLRRTSSAIF